MKILIEDPVNEKFGVKESSLDYLSNSPTRLSNGFILLCIQGEAHITVNFENCFLKERMQAFVLPQSIVTVIDRSNDFKIMSLSFSNSMMDKACFKVDSEIFSFMVDNFLHRFSPEIFRQKMDLLNVMRMAYEDRTNRFRKKIFANYLQNYFLDSFDKIYHDIGKQESKKISRKEDLFRKFISFAHQNYTHTRKVEFYAGALNISPRYLSAITQSVCRISAKHFIDNLILQEIKLLLQDSELSIQEIADKLNFPDQSHLGRFFKNKSGISPSEYRRSIPPFKEGKSY
ncbi:MAG: helix-turn-helix domain-containing protein [Prevotellaceae bacterium]|jgi:AraC-like DNA-binding protein|nr:helix-turn-helix domain-containing protein [Prevotellaceae bacterium]